jgi:hypothetical protein
MNQDDPAITRRYGTMLTICAAVAGLLYTAALLRRSYWAIALPVTAIVAAGLGAAVVLGRLLMTTPDEPADPL